MIVKKSDSTFPCFDDYSLNGTILTIAGIATNLEDEQQDQEVIIPFGRCNGMIHRGLMSCCSYVAEITIPPRRYELVEVSEEVVEDEEEENVRPGTHTESVPLPIDIESVVLTLWPYEPEAENNNHLGQGNE